MVFAWLKVNFVGIVVDVRLTVSYLFLFIV